MPLGPPTLIGLPYDASSSYMPGPASAPWLLREALRSEAGNVFTEDLHDLGVAGALEDAGDLVLPTSGDARDLIEAGIGLVLAGGGRPLALGGDHSITYPVLRALRGSAPTLSVLHIDAHPDLYDEFAGDRYSHACPFARVMEDGLADRLVQVGIRATTQHQQEQADRFGVEVIDMRAWAAGTRPTVTGVVYVSLDLDGLDPGFAPGVSHREPGGLSVREVVALIQGLSGPVIGADVVEFNPRQDTFGLTAVVGAKLIKELAAAMLRTAGTG